MISCYRVIRDHAAFKNCFLDAAVSFYTESFLSFVAQVDSMNILIIIKFPYLSFLGRFKIAELTKTMLKLLQSLGLFQILNIRFREYLLEMFQAFVLENTDPSTLTSKLQLEKSYCASFQHWAHSILFPWLKEIDQFPEYSYISDKALNIFLEARSDSMYDVLVSYPKNMSALEDFQYLFEQLGPEFDFRKHIQTAMTEEIQSKWLKVPSALIAQKNVLQQCVYDICCLFRSLTILDDSGYLAFSLLDPISSFVKKSNHSNMIIAELLFSQEISPILFPDEHLRNGSSSAGSLFRESLLNMQKLKKIRLYNQLSTTDPALLELFDNDELSWRPSSFIPLDDVVIPEYFKQGDIILFLLTLSKSKIILFDAIQAVFGKALLDSFVSNDFLLEVVKIGFF